MVLSKNACDPDPVKYGRGHRQERYGQIQFAIVKRRTVYRLIKCVILRGH